MDKARFREELEDLILKHPPELAKWYSIFKLEDEGRREEAERLRKQYFGPPKKSIFQYASKYIEEHIADPICNAYKSFFKRKSTF